MAMLTRADILSVKLPTRVVPVPEWGGEVIVRALTGLERDRFEMHLKNLKDSGLQSSFSTRAYIASCACVDGEGKRLFTESDIVALSESNAAALDRLLEAVVALSGISSDSVEDMEKNSDGDRNGSGGSGSPRGSAARSRKSKRG